MNFSIPAKTFLLGEYCALLGGPSLIFTHTPCFRLEMSKQPPSGLFGIHPDSPAGLLYQAHLDLLTPYNISFHDPYHGIGGVGASSAQFLGIYRALCSLSSTTLFQKPLLHTYWEYAYDQQGIKPSGADIIAQSNGGLCYFHPNEKQCESASWPFESLSLLLIHTQNKLATHEHLKSFEMKDNIKDLHPIVLRAKTALSTKVPNDFIDAFKDFSAGLIQRQLVASHTHTLLNSLSARGDVIAAKGAGAMGADIIIILCEREDEASLKNTLKHDGFPLLATQSNLAPATNIDIKPAVYFAN